MAKLILALLAVGALALAGCMSDTSAPMTVTKTSTQTVQATNDSPLHAQLHQFYNQQPYKAAGTSMADVPGGTPDHEWRVLQDGRLEYLHWDTASSNGDISKADKLLFIGDGVPGLDCLGVGGISQAQIDAGYNHFHKLHAGSFAAGHHMDPADNHVTGYWLRHLAPADGSIFFGLDSTHLGASNPLKAC